MKYIDLYLLPVPEANIPAYKKVAAKFGKIAKEHGMLSYNEFMGNDLEAKEGLQSFVKAAKPKDGETVVVAVAEFKSRAHRDQVMKKLMADPRMAEIEPETPLFSMKKMHYGGFSGIVSA
ncbi:MAG TPA: DUF1428 domain-containing protein [Candidatus Paceibacterota bacterium]|nr:DUF1428 domain-containing protein [Candidatus Paceibacterota bacterium]